MNNVDCMPCSMEEVWMATLATKQRDFKTMMKLLTLKNGTHGFPTEAHLAKSMS